MALPLDPNCAELLLRGGKVTTLLDARDLHRASIHQWGATKTGRVMGTVFGRRSQFLHRFIMGAKPDEIVDHINGNAMDNRRSNLRFASASENARNSRMRSNSTGFKGVKFDKRSGRFSANIHRDGKQTHIGMYDTAEKAALAYDESARADYGAFAALNFPSCGEQAARR